MRKNRIRKTMTKDSPKEIIEKFKKWYTYDPTTGEISSELKKSYPHVTKKGYKGNLSLTHNNIEYSIIYHRLAWLLYYGEFVPCGKQIDHIDNIKLNNKIENLRVVTNAKNAYKRGLNRKNNTSGYKGVTYTIDKIDGYEFGNFVASIGVDGKRLKIGRFKEDKILAAKFYDSANRFYFKEFANPNFDEEFIPPLSIQDLRKLKRALGSQPGDRLQEKLDELLESCALKDVGREVRKKPS